MRNSSPPPHPPTPSPLRKRRLTSPKTQQGPPASNYLHRNDKKTRDLPNLSDCHGCGIRINYSNPKERLQPLNSVWRIVLLCKKCRKQVNSGQICSYCFQVTGNSVPDCTKCSDCERYIHKNCIVKYGNSTPWSYCCKDLGLGFTVCIDCWLPELLRNSIRVRRRDKSSVQAAEELCATKGDSWGLKKDTGLCTSLVEAVKDANCEAEKKVVLAVKAKEKALRKAVVAKNAMELASNALDLFTKKNRNGNNGGVLVGSSGTGRDVNNVTRVVDDVELAFQLHRAMNSSPRISKNMCSMNLSYSDVLKPTGPSSVDLRAGDSRSVDIGGGDGGKLGRCSNTKGNGNRNSNILVSSACISAKGGDSSVHCGRLKSELKTYVRNNRKRKECQGNGDVDLIGTSVGVVGNCTISDDNRIVSKSQSCWQGELKQELHVNDSRMSSQERCEINFNGQNRSVNANSDRYLLKYGKRITGSRRGSLKEAKSIHEETDSSCVSFEKDTRTSAPGLPMYISAECTALPSFSLHSFVVNLQACASVGISSQREG